MSNLTTGRPSRKDKAIAAMNSGGSTIRMNVNIEKEFYRQIKQKALDEESSITEIVKSALKQYMSQ